MGTIGYGFGLATTAERSLLSSAGQVLRNLCCTCHVMMQLDVLLFVCRSDGELSSLRGSELSSDISCSAASESESDSSEDEEDADNTESAVDRCQIAHPTSKALWSREQLPEGTSGHACWDWANILAAQDWCCPCRDRRNCIGRERMKPEQLLLHRKEFQTSVAPFHGGLRDCTRGLLEEHYSKASKAFTRSFVVGELSDCCAASRGLADGLAFVTWARARADVRKGRPRHAGRVALREREMHQARRVINAYIRNLRESMEGSKGGSRGEGKSYTGRQSKRMRYQAYCSHRIKHQLPVLGSEKLFTSCWKAQEGIVELRRTGHNICSECCAIATQRDIYEGRHDEAARENMTLIEQREEQHRQEHRGERDYADDFWTKAETRPARYSMLNMDAPTQDQLEIPVQATKYRDAPKGLDGAPRWASKMMGVMIAGLGMVCYLAHQRLGGGANLSCTCLYLALLYAVDNGHPLGSCFTALLDNTAAENKNNEVIFFISWLVAIDVFEEASFFCMMVGHTYTGLDRSFNTMSSYLKQVGVYTVSALIQVIWSALKKFNCLYVFELHALWDWKAYFAPHVCERLGGFCTSQHGQGMHEFQVRKDHAGIVRLCVRKSSQASGWFPEGPGYQVFDTIPEGVLYSYYSDVCSHEWKECTESKL